MFLAGALPASADEVDFDVVQWAREQPLWGAVAALVTLLLLVGTARWLISNRRIALVLGGLLVALVLAGQAELIPTAIMVFVVFGVLGWPIRWWERRRGPRTRVLPPEPPPMPHRCTAPMHGYCPIHGEH